MKCVIPVVLYLLMFMMMGRVAVADERPIILHSIAEDDWHPIYYYSGPEMRLEGLMAELIEALFVRELGWLPKTRPRPWARAQSEVEDGKTDFFVTIPTEAREEYAVATSIPLFHMQMNLYTYAGHPQLPLIQKVRTVEDIKELGLVLVSNQGNGWHRSNMEEKGVRTQWVRGDEEIIRFLSLKRADAMIDFALTMNHRIQELGLNEQLVQTDVIFGAIDLYVMVGKKSPFASRVEEINAALRRMRERGVFQRLWSKYE